MRLALAFGLPLGMDPERRFGVPDRSPTGKADLVRLPAESDLLSGGECEK